MDIGKIPDSLDNSQKKLASKIISGKRITTDEALFLYKEFDLGLLGFLADHVRKNINEDMVYYNHNVHLEPTNICIHNCLFCSYRRKINQEGAWEYSLDEIRKIVQGHREKNITEIHIVGGVHPHRNVKYYAELLEIVRKELPGIHIKAFTAAEVEHMAWKERMKISDALILLKEAGLDSMPGGGAEIFDEDIRKKICPDKTGSKEWLNVHREAHQLGIQTNCTMLYGHIENYEHRVDHLFRLRTLQDETLGFNAFIPLKYRSRNNQLSEIGETSPVDDLKNFAVSRIFLDNIPHLKAYWPMIGKDLAAIALSFGVDDLDGTIQDTTKIYSMAGADDQKPGMTVNELISIILRAGRKPVERDSLYNPVKIF
jgi:aminodeoxyfutalosine synthase